MEELKKLFKVDGVPQMRSYIIEAIQLHGGYTHFQEMPELHDNEVIGETIGGEVFILTAKKAPTAEEMLRSLLARIHRDGGHYTEEHGLKKSVEDADQLIADMLATTTKFVIEKKSVLPYWDEQGSHSTLEQAQSTLPYYRGSSKRAFRIVKVTRKILYTEGDAK